MNQLYCSPDQLPWPGCGSRHPRKLFTVPVKMNGRPIASLKLCATCMKKYKQPTSVKGLK